MPGYHKLAQVSPTQAFRCLALLRYESPRLASQRMLRVCARVHVRVCEVSSSTRLNSSHRTQHTQMKNSEFSKRKIAHQNRHIRLNLTKHMHSHSLHCQNSATVCLRRNEQNSENRKNSQKFQHHFKLLSLRCFSSRLESRQRPLLC